MKKTAIVKVEDVKVDHPDFGYIHEVGFAGVPVVIFNRDEWKTPTPEQAAKYEEDEKIVMAHGGHMNKTRWQIAGQNDVFTEADCRAMVEATKKAFQEYVIGNTWNGKGCYTFSVSIAKEKS